ncbi:MAG TPA: metal ABC transporter permease [Candidatus Thermoplasmatota archaeon]|nr:metal ABC transporter permease [Candidatus Thermoplasmatota archaeon]
MTAIDLFLQYEFLQRALLAALAVAALCAALGVYVVLRGLSMLGDGLAHISFAGVALGLVLGLYPLALALIAAVAGALIIHALRAKEVVRGDTAIGILFTAGLATGILLVSRSRGLGVDLSSYLFGNLLAVGARDVATVGAIAGALLLILVVLHKELFYVTFNEEAARLSGLPVGMLNVLFTAATAASIVIAARVVGVLLVSALLVVPAATALQFERSFRATLAISVATGLASVLIGVWAAAEYSLATGASVALTATALFALVVLVKRALPRAAA